MARRWRRTQKKKEEEEEETAAAEEEETAAAEEEEDEGDAGLVFAECLRNKSINLLFSRRRL